MHMSQFATLLVATPSFLGGAATLIDLGSTGIQYNTSRTPLEADAIALGSDWAAVSSDFQRAMDKFRAEREAQPALEL